MFSTFSTRYCIFFEVSSKSVNLDARLSPVYWRCNFSIGINISSSFKKSPLTKPDKNSPLYSICTGLYPTKGIPRVLFISTFLFLFHSQDPLMISCHISIRFFNNQQRIIKGTPSSLRHSLLWSRVLGKHLSSKNCSKSAQLGFSTTPNALNGICCV